MPTVLTTEESAENAAKIAALAEELGGAAIVEEIRAYYWWDNAVQNDPEWRVAISSPRPFDVIEAAISKAHSYDVPMIVSELEGTSGDYWLGRCPKPDAEVARQLVEARCAACVQLGADFAVKTTSTARGRVDALLPGLVWRPIQGNAAYLRWLDEECKAE